MRIDDFLRPLIVEPSEVPPAKRGRKPLGAVAMTNVEQNNRCRQGDRERRLSHIAVLDMETDPFEKDRDIILPFVAELYSDQFGSIVIWDEVFERFIDKLVSAIEALPDRYVIYAHNGGKLDFMFLIHKIRGIVKFKGRAIMVAKIGNHELRDSLHLLPERLAAWKKDHFDYRKMRRCSRNKYRQEILDYLHSDCVYLFEIIKSFVAEFGLKLSIGQAAFTELKKIYKVSRVKEDTDKFLRRYFFGGRVECIVGRGVFESSRLPEPYKLYDVNSMYPHVMATYDHPIGTDYLWRRGEPDKNTVFLDLTCESFGAFVRRSDDGFSADTDQSDGRFHVTIWEYLTALKYNLIENVKIIGVVDCLQRTNFSKFIIPMYERRQRVKGLMKELELVDKIDTTEYEELKKEDLFLKYLLNNSYGKFAQDPRRYKEYCYTDGNKAPDKDWFDFLKGADDDTIHQYSMAVERCDEFAVWARPSPDHRFNNVGTAASITGAARAILLEATQFADDPIYCDTDSLICRSLNNSAVDHKKLGSWKLEQTFDDCIIAGKKEYVCRVAGLANGHERRLKVRCKGADIRVVPETRDGFAKPDATPLEWERANTETWKRFEKMLVDEIIELTNKAPTISKIGEQHRITRRIRATAPRLIVPTIQRRKRHAS